MGREDSPKQGDAHPHQVRGGLQAGYTGKRRQMGSWQEWGIRYLLHTEAIGMESSHPASAAREASRNPPGPRQGPVSQMIQGPSQARGAVPAMACQPPALAPTCFPELRSPIPFVTRGPGHEQLEDGGMVDPALVGAVQSSG